MYVFCKSALIEESSECFGGCFCTGLCLCLVKKLNFYFIIFNFGKRKNVKKIKSKTVESLNNKKKHNSLRFLKSYSFENLNICLNVGTPQRLKKKTGLTRLPHTQKVMGSNPSRTTYSMAPSFGSLAKTYTVTFLIVVLKMNLFVLGTQKSYFC